MTVRNSIKYRALCILLVLILLNALEFQSVHAYNELDYIKTIIQEKYIYTLDSSYLRSNNVKEMFKKLDRHSAYYTKDEFKSFMQSINGSIGGIGVYIQKDDEGYILISEVIKDSPAEKLGLEYGDLIIDINDDSTKDMTINAAANLIKGDIGSKINLKILKADNKKIEIIEATRTRVKVESVTYSILEGDIGYLKISGFNENAADEVKAAINYFNRNNIEKTIIDLRGNGGGLLDEVLEISKVFIKKATIVHIKSKTSTITHTSYTDQTPYKKDNLVVLIDEHSASASEILAAAIQDNNSGIVVGKTSYGKGTVQRLYSLYSGAGFKLTESIYLSPKMKEIEGIGVKPDYEVDRFKSDPGPDNVELTDLDNLNLIQIRVKDQVVIPARDLFEKLNYKVEWDQDSKMVIAKNEKIIISLPVNEKTIYINDKEVEIEEQITIVDGVTILSESAVNTILKQVNNNLKKVEIDLQIEFAIKLLN